MTRRRKRVLQAVFTLASSAALYPIVLPMIDWGMDGSLSPDAWQLVHLLKGTLLSGIILGICALPALFLLPIPVAYVGARRLRASRNDCPTCGGTEVEDGVCAGCGPIPPRAADARSGNVFRIANEGTEIVLRTILPVLVAAWILSAVVSWIVLEVEEDGFGTRARTARDAGRSEYSETGMCGGHFTWTDEYGYGAHRD